MQITKNFSLKEFDCHCGCEMPSLVKQNIIDLAYELQILRNEVGALKVTSGYRCPAYNKKIGGESRSQHILGKAADIISPIISQDRVADIVERLLSEREIEIGGIGRYDTFTHIDIRREIARWDYRKLEI